MSQEFKNKLIAADLTDSSPRAVYERKLGEMLEAPLQGPRKAGLIFATLVCLFTLVLCAVNAYRFRHGPAIVLEGMGLGILFGIIGAILTLRILLRGTYRQRDNVAQVGLIWVFTVLLVTLFMIGEGLASRDSVRMTVWGIVFLISAAVMLLRTVIEQAELRTREKLLEIQYELAELKDAMKHSPRGG